MKKALSKTTNRAEKQVILTTLPHDWGVKKIQKIFGVSRHLASTAIKLRRDKGFSPSCDSKPGRPMHPDIINEVQEFYLSDDISRVMPGAKDYKSVVIDGKRQQMTVIFLRQKVQEYIFSSY